MAGLGLADDEDFKEFMGPSTAAAVAGETSSRRPHAGLRTPSTHSVLLNELSFQLALVLASCRHFASSPRPQEMSIKYRTDVGAALLNPPFASRHLVSMATAL
eukprot:4681040-Amphidinium_carterae.1